MVIAGARTTLRRTKGLARRETTSSHWPEDVGRYELFSIDSITAGGAKQIADRYYQVEAVQAICAGLAAGGRGQLRAACGTGKTVMAQRAAELLCPLGGLVVIVCPSVALVAQTLREWQETTDNFIALGVCGDDTVADAIVTVDEIPATVTTNSADVAGWLATDTNVRLRLIIGTHRSSHIIGQALLDTGATADLLIIDEAHRTAGMVDKHSALVHDDARFPAARRLYATATPKLVGENARGEKRKFSKVVVGMDDHKVFGPVLYNYPFSKAIEDGYLDDYRLVVVGVTRSEIAEYLSTLPRTATARNVPTSLHTAMVQTVLAKAARQYGFRRALTFCRRLSEAADFARTMNATIAGLPARMKPKRKLTTAFVHGDLNTTEREQRLARLVDPPDNGWTVVTNVRCLAEGVDVPTIDAVAFTHPKQSVSEIVQAIGRALRCDPEGTGTATILVPLMLPDDPADINDLNDVNVADYKLLWQVVKALRGHDDKLGAAIDSARTWHRSSEPRAHYVDQPLEHVLIDLPSGYDDGTILHQLTAKIIHSARNTWWNSYAALRAFHDERGHTAVRRDYTVVDPVTKRDIQLGVWVETQRATYRKGLLADDRVTALEEIGFDFHPRAVEWRAGLNAAKTYFAAHGHLEPVRTLRVRGVDLLAWLDKQRARAAEGKLADSRRAALDELGMRWNDHPKTFDDHIAALARYREQHGHINLDPEPGTEAGYLGSWLVAMRIKRKMRQLTPGQVGALEALGMQWTRPRTTRAEPVPPAPPKTPPDSPKRAVKPDAPTTKRKPQATPSKRVVKKLVRDSSKPPMPANPKTATTQPAATTSFEVAAAPKRRAKRPAKPGTPVFQGART